MISIFPVRSLEMKIFDMFQKLHYVLYDIVDIVEAERHRI